MTGQDKEDILSRFGELGIFVKDGKLYFHPCMLRKEEFLDEASNFNYVDVNSEERQIELKPDSIAFTVCQVPVIYQISDKNRIKIFYKDDQVKAFESLTLDKESSTQVFNRSGDVIKIIASVNESDLK